MPVFSTRGPHVCPRCHERVTPFAAGCALCGADLDPRRAQAAPALSARVRALLRGRRPSHRRA